MKLSKEIVWTPTKNSTNFNLSKTLPPASLLRPPPSITSHPYSSIFTGYLSPTRPPTKSSFWPPKPFTTPPLPFRPHSSRHSRLLPQVLILPSTCYPHCQPCHRGEQGIQLLYPTTLENHPPPPTSLRIIDSLRYFISSLFRLAYSS